MNLFVAVSPKKLNILSSFHDALLAAIPITIPFYSENHDKVIFNNGLILAASFSIHALSCPIKNYVGYDEQSFCTFNGVPQLTNNKVEPWGTVLLNGLKSRSIDLQNLGGYYNLAFVEGGTLEAYNCLSRIEPLYWFENAECVVVGNRASLVWAVGNRSTDFEYDEMALLTFSTAGWLVNDATPFKNVSVLPNGYKIIATRSNLKIEPYKSYEFKETNQDIDSGKIIEFIQNELIQSIQFFSEFNEKILVNLSGGKDSRILAASCDRAGIQYACSTFGSELDPDMIIAKEVVKILKNPEHVIYQLPSGNNDSEADIFQIVKQHLRISEGMLNLYGPAYNIRKNPDFFIIGHGGELLRGGYDRSIERPIVKNREMALKFLKDLNLHNEMFFLKKDAVQYQLELNEKLFERFVYSGFPFENFYDWVYTVYREGRATCNYRQADAYGTFRFAPFLNDNVLKSAWQLPLTFRKEEYLFFYLLKSLNSELSYHRFADSRWKFEINAPVPGSSLVDWEKRAPLPPGPSFPGANLWRSGYDGYLRPVMRDYLLQDRNNKIYSYIDIEKLEKVLNESPPTVNSKIISVFGIFTAAYLFNNEWLR